MSIRFLRRLWPLLSPHAHLRLRLASVGAFVVAALDAIGIAFVLPLARLMTALDQPTVPDDLRWLADRVGIESPGALAGALAGAVVGCFVLKGVLALILLRSTLRTSLDAEAAVATRLLRGYLAAPMEFHLRHHSAELQRTIQDSTRRVFQEALVATVPALGDQLLLVVVSVVLVVLAPVEAIVGGLFMVGLVRVYRRLSAARTTASSEALLEETRRSIQHVQQSISAYKEVRVAGTIDHFADDLLAVRERVAARQRTLTLTELLPRYYLEIGIVAGAALIGAVAFARHDAPDAVALVALFLAASLRMLPSLNRVLVAENKSRVAMPNLERILDDLDALNRTVDDRDRDPRPMAAGEAFDEVRLAGASVRYEGADGTALWPTDLTIRRGERVVFVGRSGAGKTTALNLVLGLLSPVDGEVLVNDVPLPDRRHSWFERLAYVPQDVAVLDSSIAENVALGVPRHEVDADGVRAALEQAQLLDLVDSLPSGIDDTAGEGGNRLSGGQRQRLGLARAFHQAPQVLLLDEATASLDAKTEADVLSVLDSLDAATTVVAVAHRRSAIERFDRVVVFEGGRIVDDDDVAAVRSRHPDLFGPDGSAAPSTTDQTDGERAETDDPQADEPEAAG